SVFDKRYVEVVEAGAAESAAAERSEAAVVGAGAVREVDRDVEERDVVVAASEVVAAHGAAGGEVRRGDEVGAVGAACARSRLLDPGVDGEWRAAHQGGDVQELPSGSERSAKGPQKTYPIERQDLNPAQSEDVGDVEGGRAFFCAGVPGILRR